MENKKTSVSALFAPDEVYVGRDLGGQDYVISPELVSKYIDGTGDNNPWYRGPSPLGGPLAPVLSLYWAVFANRDWYLPNLYGNLHARQEWESFEPFHMGDKLRTRLMVVDRYEKRDREYVVAEVQSFDTVGRLLSRSRTHQSFLRADRQGAGFAVDRSREKAPERVFKVGESGGEPVALEPRRIDHAMCLAFSGPHRNYHNDLAKARELGFPEIVVQGMLSVCLVAEMMTRRFGLGFYYGGRLDLRLVNVLWCNEVTAARGLIVRRRTEGRRMRAELEVWCEKSDGVKTVVGSASALEL
jgi:acyl dehydratase